MAECAKMVPLSSLPLAHPFQELTAPSLQSVWPEELLHGHLGWITYLIPLQKEQRLFASCSLDSSKVDYWGGSHYSSRQYLISSPSTYDIWLWCRQAYGCECLKRRPCCALRAAPGCCRDWCCTLISRPSTSSWRQLQLVLATSTAWSYQFSDQFAAFRALTYGLFLVKIL